MKKFTINESKRRFFVYSFPDTADESGNYDLTLLTDSDYCVTSVSSPDGNLFYLYNLSIEKQTIPSALPILGPIIYGNGGTPYFFPLPWRLKAGTILRLVPVTVTAQISIAGYRI
jgi:hypothetical protein